MGVNYIRVAADVRDPVAMRQAAEQTVERFGRLDSAICSVGAARAAPLAEMTPAHFQQMLDINLNGAFHSAQAALPALRETRGSIVFVSAVGAHSQTPMTAAYGAAKAALEHLTRSAAAEWGPEVRVNCVSLGLILTEGSRKVVFRGSQDLVDAASRTIAVGRLGAPQDVAWAVHYLITPAAGFVSGAVLTLDGGEVQGPMQRLSGALARKSGED